MESQRHLVQRVEAGKTPAKPLPDRLDELLNQIATARSKDRPGLVNQTVNLVTACPANLIAGTNHLKTREGTLDQARSIFYRVYDEAREIFSKKIPKEISPDKLENEVLVKDFTDLFIGLVHNSPSVAETAKRALQGYFDQPQVIYDRKQDKACIEQAAARAVNIAYAYATALINVSDDEARKKAAEFFMDVLYHPQENLPDFFDFFNFAVEFGSPLQLGKAQAGFETTSICHEIFVKHLEPDKRFQAVLVVRDEKLRTLKAKAGLTRDPNQIPVEFVAKYDVINTNVDKFLEDPALSDCYVYVKPEPLALGNKSLRFLMEHQQKRLAKHNCDSVIIPCPGGINLMFFWRKGQLPEKEQKEKIRKILLDIYSENQVTNPPTAQETTTLFRYLLPDINRQRLTDKISLLLPLARGGFHALSSRRDFAVFNLPEEEYLRAMGFSGISFRKIRGGIEVELYWADIKINFNLDRSYNLQGLEEVDKVNRDWLTALVYSYIADIKSPSESAVRMMEQRHQSGKLSLLDEDATRRILSRKAHLRVLPLGHVSRASADPKIRSEMEFDFDVDLDELNTAFELVQAGLMKLDEIDPSMRDLIAKAMRTIAVRPGRPVSPAEAQNINYAITYVRKIETPESEKLEPLVYSCRRAAATMATLSHL